VVLYLAQLKLYFIINKDLEKYMEVEKTEVNDRLEGKNPLLEALKAGRTINKLWVLKYRGKQTDSSISRIVEMAKQTGAVVIETDREVLDKMSLTRGHQGVIAQVASHEYVDIDKIISDAKAKNKNGVFIVILDELKESYNLGSILRISDAAGVDGIVIPKHRSVGLDANVAKASAGAIEYVPVAKVTNISQTIEKLKEEGFWIYGTSQDAKDLYNKVDYKGNIAIVVGSEGEGIKESVINKCDFLVKIPMYGNVNSLNAAVASGVIIFEAARQRNGE